MKMCFWERTVMHCSPQQRAFWAIWWLWVWHMDRVDGSSPVQIHYSWTYHTTSPHPSFFLFPFFFTLSVRFPHCKPTITISRPFWPEVMERKLLPFWQYATLSHLSSLSLSLSQLLCYVVLDWTGSCSGADKSSWPWQMEWLLERANHRTSSSREWERRRERERQNIYVCEWERESKKVYILMLTTVWQHLSVSYMSK